MIEFKSYLNGSFVESNSQKWIEISSPETNKVVGRVPDLDKSQVEEVFELASKAQPGWEQLSKEKRCAILNKFADLLNKNEEQIAEIMVQEIAKGKSSAIGEVKLAATYIRKSIKWYLNEPIYKIMDEKDHGKKDKIIYVGWKAYGVATIISPFNYPVNLAISKFIPALLAGNAVVFKAATSGMLTGAKISKLMHEAGIPKAIFNNPTGRGSKIGDLLVTNPRVKAISFTGSTQVGERIASLVAKKVTVLELGGKCPAIIFTDADLELAANKIMKGAFSYSGQRCTAVKRVVAHSSISKKLEALLIEKIKGLSIGKAKDNTTITALINKSAVRHVVNLVNDAKEKGANLNGFELKVEGNLVHPMLISNVTSKMDLYYEEQFGPTLPVINFKTEAEAVKIANDSIYGLQASIFTKDIDLARRVGDQIKTGSINVNSFPQSGPVEIPFLGVKGSGFLVQNIPYALNNMRRPSNFVINKN